MKSRYNSNNIPLLRGKERIPFEKINAKLITLGWDSSIEYDSNWSWFILAIKNDPSWGVLLRRIKPFKIINPDNLFTSVKFQKRFKNDLVEIVPFKTYKGSRIYFPELTDDIDFMSEAKFQLFRKFFQSSDFSLESMDKSKAIKKEKAIVRRFIIFSS